MNDDSVFDDIADRANEEIEEEEEDDDNWSSTSPLLRPSFISTTSNLISKAIQRHNIELEEREHEYLDSMEIDGIRLGNLDALTGVKDQEEQQVQDLSVIDVPDEIKESEALDAELRKTLDSLRQFELDQRMKQAEKKVAKVRKGYLDKKYRMHKHSVQYLRSLSDESRLHWKKMEDSTKSALTRMNAELVYHYPVDKRKIPVDRKKWSLVWKREPQLLLFEFQMLTSANHELWMGNQEEHLVICVSMFDRLGGFELTFSKTGKPSKIFKRVFSLKDKRNNKLTCTRPFTRPQNHSSQLHDSRVLFICPSNQDLHPRMVFVFELYSLSQRKVIAWGVFPAVNSNLELISDDYYKCALVTGQTDTAGIDTYKKWFNVNTDFWFGNMYFKASRISNNSYLEDAGISEITKTKYILEIQHDSSQVSSISPDLQKYYPAPNRAILNTKEDKSVTRTWFGTAQLSAMDDVHYDSEEDDDDDETLTLRSDGGLMEDLENPPYLNPEINETEFIVHRQSVKQQEHTWTKKPLYAEKLMYLFRTIQFDLGFHSWRSIEFYLMIILAVIIFYARYWPHYFAQWIYLSAGNAAVPEANWKPWNVYLGYRPEFQSTAFNLGYTYTGSLSNILLFVIMAVFVAAMQSRFLFRTLPVIAYRVVMLYGFSTILDPLLILVSDVIFHRGALKGEPFVLARQFNYTDNSIVPGLLISIFTYFQTITLAVFLNYMYALRIHMHGRVWDVYHRLHAEENEMAIPCDFFVTRSVLDQYCGMDEKDRTAANHAKSVTKKILVKDIEEDLFSLHIMSRIKLLLHSRHWPNDYLSNVKKEKLEFTEEQRNSFMEIIRHYCDSELSSDFEATADDDTAASEMTEERKQQQEAIRKKKPAYWMQTDDVSSGRRVFAVTNLKYFADMVLFDEYMGAISDHTTEERVRTVLQVLTDYHLLELPHEPNSNVLAGRMYLWGNCTYEKTVIEEQKKTLVQKVKQAFQRMKNQILPGQIIEAVKRPDDDIVENDEFMFEANTLVRPLVRKLQKDIYSRSWFSTLFKRKKRSDFREIVVVEGTQSLHSEGSRQTLQAERDPDKLYGKLIAVYDFNTVTAQKTIRRAFVQTPFGVLCEVLLPDDSSSIELLLVGHRLGSGHRKANMCRVDKEEYWIQRALLLTASITRDWSQQAI